MPIRRLSAWLAFAALLSVLSMLSACDAESGVATGGCAVDRTPR